MELLESRQLRGPRVRITGNQLTRRWPVPPFRIYYRELADEIEIIRVYHQARRPVEQ
jgi:plasmid stabilization system protein ParE